MLLILKLSLRVIINLKIKFDTLFYIKNILRWIEIWWNHVLKIIDLKLIKK